MSDNTPEETLANCADATLELDKAQFDLDQAKEWCANNAAPAEVWMILASSQLRITNGRRMTKRRSRLARQEIEE